MTCSFGPKSKDNLLKNFLQLYDIDQMFRRFILTCPKNYQFQIAPTQKLGGFWDTHFRCESQDPK